ncbi:GNAT family N-acetyltransferase [candidate division WOR-3 bacterium]|nr:GNAT family N-acetyltransferase [candidate division WOR-3 bacterium]
MKDSFEIIEISEKYRKFVVKYISDNWGSSILVSCGKIHDSENLQGFVAIEKGVIKGIATFEIVGKVCEIVSLDSMDKGRGIGKALVEKIIDKAAKEKCSMVWLITTNDNTKAMRFYQKIGFIMSAFYKNALNESRKLKPEIPLTGNDGIPLLHEIKFEKILL